MPELPDVEAFRRRLERHGHGRRIEAVTVLDAGVVRNTSGATLRRRLAGRRLSRPQRRGKWLLAPTDGPTLLVHFGMTGSLEWEAEPHPHDRVVFRLDGGELRYRDQRKLQGLWLAADDDEATRIIGPQGPDAPGLAKDRLRERLAGRTAGLKGALMDQTVVAGLGNIVTDEVLWRSRLHPNRRPRSLTPAEWTRLHRAVGTVLRASVKEGQVPARRTWLTGVRDERHPACPRCGTPYGARGPSDGPPGGARPANHPRSEVHPSRGGGDGIAPLPPAGMLVEHWARRVMLDGGPGAEPAPGPLDAWLVTDARGELMP